MNANKPIFKISNEEKFNQFIKDNPDFEYRKQDVLLKVIAHVPMYVFQDAHGKLQYSWESPKLNRMMH